MAKTSQAVETLDRLMVQFDGMKEARDQLREIGSYDDAIEGRKTALKDTEAEVTKAKALLDEANKLLDTTITKARTEWEASQAAVKAQLDDAKKQAAAILDDAKAQAAKSLQTAKDQEAGKLKSLRDEIDKGNKTLDALTKSIADANAEAKVAKQQATDAQAWLDSIQKKAATVAGVA